MEIRYHLDESVGHGVADGLRLRGIDATTTTTAGILSVDDPTQIAYALREHRVIVTHDDDFLRIHAAGTGHAGICYCHQRKLGIGQIVGRLVFLWRTQSAEEMEGVVEFL